MFGSRTPAGSRSLLSRLLKPGLAFRVGERRPFYPPTWIMSCPLSPFGRCTIGRPRRGASTSSRTTPRRCHLSHSRAAWLACFFVSATRFEGLRQPKSRESSDLSPRSTSPSSWLALSHRKQRWHAANVWLTLRTLAVAGQHAAPAVPRSYRKPLCSRAADSDVLPLTKDVSETIVCVSVGRLRVQTCSDSCCTLRRFAKRGK